MSGFDLFQPVVDSPDFSVVITFSQSISQWVILIVAGTTALILGKSHVSPSGKPFRLIYLLLLPAWALFALSVWEGVKVQRHFLALKILAPADTTGIKRGINHDLWWQLRLMEFGLGVVVAFLVCYLFWWTFSAEAASDRS